LKLNDDKHRLFPVFKIFVGKTKTYAVNTKMHFLSPAFDHLLTVPVACTEFISGSHTGTFVSNAAFNSRCLKSITKTFSIK